MEHTCNLPGFKDIAEHVTMLESIRQVPGIACKAELYG